MKQCRKCKEIKDDGLFYNDKKSSDGLYSYCKECAHLLSKKWYADNLEKAKDRVREYQRNHPEIEKKRDRSDYKKQYRYSDNGRIKVLASERRRKKLKNPNKCSICGIETRTHGHHPDYNEPLNVVWCCPQCHSNIHSGANAQ